MRNLSTILLAITLLAIQSCVTYELPERERTESDTASISWNTNESSNTPAFNPPRRNVTAVSIPSTDSNEIPITYSMHFPLMGNWWNTTGFGFGEYGSSYSGYHLAVDTIVSKTPVDTPVFSPCTGIVRVSDNIDLGGYGANNSTHPNYRGYVLVVECKLENGQNITALLGHVQSGSDYYDSTNHNGLAPLDSLVYAGQYVAKVASFWNGSGYESDWHHLHFGIRLGSYSSGNINEHVRGYSNSGWSNNYTSHESWVDPTQFVITNSMNKTWHPDGSLLQQYAGSDIYQLLGGQLFKVEDWDTFVAHNFAVHRLIYVSQAELDCYPYGGEINWKPIRATYRNGNSYFMVEKNCTSCQGTIYSFESSLAFHSWGYNDNSPQTISNMELTQLQVTHNIGSPLNVREGTVVYLGDKSSFDVSNITISLGSGFWTDVSQPNQFWHLGYGFDEIIETNSSQLFTNLVTIDYSITDFLLNSCSINNEVFICNENEETSSFSAGNNFIGIGLCQSQINKCLSNEWTITQNEILPTNELNDNLDNDCDGETDEDFFIAEPEPELIEVVIEASFPEIIEEVIPEITIEIVQEVIQETTIEVTEETVLVEEVISSDSVWCQIACPQPYIAHVWYGEQHQEGVSVVEMQTDTQVICLRGAPWIDFNCALPDWQNFDPDIASIECNIPYWSGQGFVEYDGEGEVWFTAMTCQ